MVTMVIAHVDGRLVGDFCEDDCSKPSYWLGDSSRDWWVVMVVVVVVIMVVMVRVMLSHIRASSSDWSVVILVVVVVKT